ncbi:MAG: hypothetical protein IJR49_02875 [Treponema sp.]|nr:hypothetical protein [Treponema sp.]
MQFFFQDDIFTTFSGHSDAVGVSVLFFGVTGAENKNWTVNTDALGICKYC